MPHDIIDSRREKLLAYIQTILPTTERARFAVGYLFLSGLKPLRERLERLAEAWRCRGGQMASQRIRRINLHLPLA